MPVQASPSYSDFFDEDPSFIEALAGAVLSGDLPASSPPRKRTLSEVQTTRDVSVSGVFKGVAIYVDGLTTPCLQDLKELIMEHGGTFHPSLDRHSMVTHIITAALTPPKMLEFQNMNVVRPEWLTESVTAGRLLPWQKYTFHQNHKIQTQGARAGQSSFAVSQHNPHTVVNIEPSTSRKRVHDEGSKDPYAASKFNEGNEYQQRKRMKLQIQNDQIGDKGPVSSLFKDLAIYVNGHTSPSFQELRKLVMEHGGVFQSYLDNHGLVTHIISTTLTAAKMEEFQYMKVVRPEWLVESAVAGRILPWQNYSFQQELKSETAQGVNTGQTSIVPQYAQHHSNPNAQRAMATRGFRESHTSAAPGFLDSYYKHSRLHLMSAWKLELRTVVEKSLAKAGELVDDHSAVIRSPSKSGKRERVIMHCDFDAFFVSAGLVDRPDLRGLPVVVCHSQGNQGGASSTSEISSCSYEAREKGIKNGMSLQQARALFPGIQTIPYDFERYKEYSLKFYEILMCHADDFQAVSIDEALLDVTSRVSRSDPNSAKMLAQKIRTQVKAGTSCNVSIGISHNILLARLATRRAKPKASNANSTGVYHLLAADAPEVVGELDIADLHGFGRAMKDKAQQKFGSSNLGDLAGKSKSTLMVALGKGNGEKVWNALRGVDDTQLDSEKMRKSVSSEVNYGIRFNTNTEVEVFVHEMAKTVEARLNAASVRGKSLTLKIMTRDPTAPVEAPKFMGHGHCNTTNKQAALSAPGGRATSDAKIIGDHAWRLLKALNIDPVELRGIGIQIQKLELTSTVATNGNGKLFFQPVAKPTMVHAPSLVDPFESQPLEDDDEIVKIPRPVSAARRPPPRQVNAVAGSSKVVATPARAWSEMPTMSQVDPSFLDALPEDVRAEIERNIKRQSAPPDPPAQSRARTSEPPPQIWPKKKITVKGMARADYKRIIHQLTEGNDELLKKPSVQHQKPRGPKWTEEQLHALGIDPEVFVELPAEIQHEELSTARFISKGGVVDFNKKHIVNKPAKPIFGPVFRRPFPKAVYPEERTLKKKDGKNLVSLKDTSDVQEMLTVWVNAHQRKWSPKETDLVFFEAFLVGSIEVSDTGMHKAIAVAKWWLRLLRRDYGEWEHEGDGFWDGIDDEDRPPQERAGRHWWTAFYRVKENMNVVARKKFGGSLAIR